MSGSDYFVHRLQVTMPLATAEAIVAGALKAGGEAKLLPLTVAVLDAGGNIVLLKRQDGSGVLRADIAIGKAWGALGMGISSRTIRDRLKDRPAFQGAIAAASDGRFIPVPGGVLILNQDGNVCGAVGISGDTSDNDEICAIAGIEVIRTQRFTPYIMGVARGVLGSPRAVISNVTEISNDIYVRGYGLALGFVPFSSESSAVVDSTQSSNNNSVDLRRGSNTATVDG